MGSIIPAARLLSAPTSRLKVVGTPRPIVARTPAQINAAMAVPAPPTVTAATPAATTSAITTPTPTTTASSASAASVMPPRSTPLPDTVRTSWRGLLNLNLNVPQRKSLLGE